MREPSVLPSYRLRLLSPNLSVAVSHSGDHAYLSDDEIATLAQAPEDLPVHRLAELKSKFFFGPQSLPGMGRLLASRIASKQETAQWSLPTHSGDNTVLHAFLSVLPGQPVAG